MQFLDTNALLTLDLEKLNKFALSTVSLQELESIKGNKNKTEDIRYAARKATHWLDENEDKYVIVIYNSQIEKTVLDLGMELNPDNKIMACAKNCIFDDNIVFVTNDVCCRVIAQNIFGLKTESTNYDSDDTYKGFLEVSMKDDELAYFYENQDINQFDLYTNEYLIIRNSIGEFVDKFRWDGETYQPVKFGNIKSDYYGSVKAYNGDIYQQCVLNSLTTNQVTMIKGPAGTGKSYLALGYMFYLLDKHKIDKIVMFVNPTPTANAAKLGFLPGTQEEKLIDSSVGNMLSGKLGDKYAIDDLINRRKLEILPMCDIRGYDTTGQNCAVYITEAQNMDISLMKLALQRIGEDSICIIDGDYFTQVDLAAYAGWNNGMRRVSEVFRGQDFYGEVELQNIYRSKIARIAQEM